MATDTSTADSANPEQPGLDPHVVIKFRDDIDLPYKSGIEHLLEHKKIGSWRALAERFPGISLHPVFSSLPPERLKELIARAEALDPNYHPPNFFSYFLITAPGRTAYDELADALREWSGVASACVVRPAPPPSPPNGGGSLNGNCTQGYLSTAPEGIDATCAQVSTVGGDGSAGVKFIDIERGWNLDHDQLSGISLSRGTIQDDFVNHGTNVLGVVCARDIQGSTMHGIVPKLAADCVHVVSTYDGGATENIASAINFATDNLSFGDVMLIERQVSGKNTADWAPEYAGTVFQAIRLATALGITVVEPAGNGNSDLGKTEDSGAIIVAAATMSVANQQTQYTKRSDSNYGARVNCFAWGEGVSPLSTQTSTQTTCFTGTSAAAAIVAGAALSAQGAYVKKYSRRLNPRQLRWLLSDPSTSGYGFDPNTDNTRSQSGLPIGVMPNLKAIIQNKFSQLPDVYMRDYVDDNGDPHSAPMAMSPDIIVRQSMADTSKWTEDYPGNDNVQLGKDHYVYLRVKNRGDKKATAVSVTVFWVSSSVYLNPKDWTEIGTTLTFDVEVNQIVVAPLIVWSKSKLPQAAGHYCLVASVGTELDAAPQPEAFTGYPDFLRFIEQNNNVAYHNFEVVPNSSGLTAGGGSGLVRLPVQIVGAADAKRPFKVEVEANMPPGSKLMVEAKRESADALGLQLPMSPDPDEEGKVQIPIESHGSHLLAEVVLEQDAHVPVSLLVNIPAEQREKESRISVRQVWEDKEVGRMTWLLVSEDDYKRRLPSDTQERRCDLLQWLKRLVESLWRRWGPRWSFPHKPAGEE